MTKTVYIETSIPSFYYNNRKPPEMIARQNWTREWWDQHRQNYELVTSEAVLEELQNGNYPHKQQAIELLSGIRLLPIETPLAGRVQEYIKHQVMPNDPSGDVLHLALASFHCCDFLLTWNCRHLANANKFSHIQQINLRLGWFTPLLITPLQLIEEKTL